MTKITNFRLDDHTLKILNDLALEMHTTKTDVIKQAVEIMVSVMAPRNTLQNLKDIHPVFKHMDGHINKKHMQEMMGEIYAVRGNAASPPDMYES